MEVSHLMSLAVTWMVAIMSPGPDMVVVLQHSLTRSRRAGLCAAAGVVTGLGLWVVAAFFGLAAVLHTFPRLLDWLQLAGGALLVYLGLSGLRQWRTRARTPARTPARSAQSDGPDAHQVPAHDVQPTRGTDRSAYLRGLGTNLANPKALVFFAAILAPFLDESLTMGATATIIGLLLVLAATWFGLLALIAGHPALAARLQRINSALDLGASVMFILIGASFCLAVLWP